MPKDTQNNIRQLPTKVPSNPEINRLKKEIEEHGFTVTFLSSHQGWEAKEINGEIRVAAKRMEDSTTGEKGLYTLWKAALSGASAAAPAAVKEEPEKETNPDLEIVDLGADPNTGQQYLPGSEVKLPRGLARVVVDEFEKKMKFTSANNEFQEAKKRRDEEVEKPIYAGFFRPHPKDKDKSYLLAGHVYLEKTTEKTSTYKSMKRSDVQWIKEMEAEGKEAA